MVKDNDFSSKRIAVNTFALYVRSFVSMLIALYSSRLLLQVLGIEDFGVYNAVGGMVMLFSFLNASLTVASQRYLNFEMGRRHYDVVNKVFCMSVNILFLLAVLMTVVCEIGGCVLLYHYLSIPQERMDAAFVVLQFSVVSLFVTIISVPYNAMIVAKEDMKSFAYIDVCCSFLKLLAVCSLTYIGYDHLIVYAFLILLVQIICGLSYAMVCHHKYSEVHFHLLWDTSLFRQMLTFSGWTSLSAMTMIAKVQGIAVLYNAFYGVVASAAIGIANQVNNALNTLVSNFTTSFNPQITKNYALGNWEQCQKLHVSGPKFSFFLLSIAATPFFLFGSYILQLWLDKVPNYTVSFVHLILIEAILKSMSSTCNTVVRATGKVGSYEFTYNIGVFLILGISYLCFLFHCGIETPFLCLVTGTAVLNIYLFYRSCMVIQIPWTSYVKNVFLRMTVAYGIPLAILFKFHLECHTVFDLIWKSFCCMVVVALSEFYIGFSSSEKQFCIKIINEIKKRVK